MRDLTEPLYARFHDNTMHFVEAEDIYAREDMFWDVRL